MKFGYYLVVHTRNRKWGITPVIGTASTLRFFAVTVVTHLLITRWGEPLGSGWCGCIQTKGTAQPLASLPNYTANNSLLLDLLSARHTLASFSSRPFPFYPSSLSFPFSLLGPDGHPDLSSSSHRLFFLFSPSGHHHRVHLVCLFFPSHLFYLFDRLADHPSSPLFASLRPHPSRLHHPWICRSRSEKNSKRFRRWIMNRWIDWTGLIA